MTRSSTIDCVRKIENITALKNTDRFDRKNYSGEVFLKNLDEKSLKMSKLLDTILKADDKDINREKTVYKHFIFSDVLSGGYGAKAIATLLKSIGFNLVLKKNNNHIIVDEEAINNPKNNYNNFVVLSSTVLWDTPFDINSAKKIISRFNDREDNIYGKAIRFIILDSTFKEGIDLLDVKYGHIFEEPLTNADKTQAIGRGVRYCGQKGLQFKPDGWHLYIYIYSTYFKNNKNEIKNILKYVKSKDGNSYVNENMIDDTMRFLASM